MQSDRWSQRHWWRLLSYYANGVLILLLSAATALAVTDPFTITVNIVVEFNMITDGGAACNGVADDAPAFIAAANTLRADPRVVAGMDVHLIVPPGATCNFTSCASGGLPVFYGLNNFTWIVTGATMTGSGGACSQWGNQGFVGVSTGGHTTPAFNTVAAGASCVTMSTPGDEAGFPPGRWVIAGAMGTQIISFPPNLGIFEFLQVASEGAGQVCFTTPLVNGYKSTWVDLGSGLCSNVSCGSNGHLYLMDSSWGHTFHVIGGTWFWPTELIWQSKTVINDNVTITSGGQNCYTPTASMTVTLNNNTYPNCLIEADKEVDQFVVNNSALNQIIFQSSSFHNFTLNNSTINSIAGTRQHTICNNSAITAGLGFGNAFGAPVSFAGTNCSISSITSGLQGNSFDLAPVGSGASTLTFYAGSGVITQPNFFVQPHINDTEPPKWYVPGTVLHFRSQNSNDGFEFTVTDHSYNLGTTTLTINTTLAGASLPGLPTNAGLLSVDPEILPDWSCSGCTGGPDAIDLSQAGAQHFPIFTYSSRTYTCLNNVPNVPRSLDINNPPIMTKMAGNWVSVTVNVITPDTTGNSAVTLSPGNQFGNLPISNQVTGALTTWGSVINLAIPGTRVINKTTTSGAQSGDTLNTPGANAWATGSSPTPFAVNVANGGASQCPVASVTWQTTR